MKSAPSSSKQEDREIVETEEDGEESSGGGRAEILIRRMDAGSSSSRQLTFSKRRNALLRRAQELATEWDSEVGLIIFACTGQMYEYSSTSMKDVIERFNRQKGEDQVSEDGPSDIKILLDEMASLKLQIKNLEESNRRLMGETSDMSTKDLQILEKQLEMSLSTVRLRKDQLMSDHINELHLKRNRVCQENVELKERMELIDRENPELNDKFYSEGSPSGGADRVTIQYDLNVPIEYYCPMPLPPDHYDANQARVTTELGIGSSILEIGYNIVALLNPQSFKNDVDIASAWRLENSGGRLVMDAPCAEKDFHATVTRGAAVQS